MATPVKDELTSFDIRVLQQELAVLEGAYLDKVYQEEDSFIFRFNVPGQGKPELFVEPGRWLYLAEGLEHPPQPPPLARNLRAAIDNAQVQRVRQKEFDRILLLEMEKGAPYTLVLEMFGEGNLILVRDGEILHVLSRQRWRTREVRPGAEYRFPPAGPDPTILDGEAFRELLRSSEGPVVRILAGGLGLGGLYAEELCFRAAVPKERPVAELTGENLERLFSHLESLVRATESPDPVLVREGGQVVDVTPFPLRLHEALESESHPTLSEALRAYWEARPRPEEETSPETERMDRRIRRQEESLEEARGDADRAGRLADLLYAHYQDVARRLRAAREGKLPEGMDPARGTLRIALEGQDVELDPEADVEENARRLYERKKEQTARAERIQAALEESRRERERIRTEGGPDRATASAPRYPSRQKFWFDAYRWSLSSEGFLILAGRDARSNEKLVRKHLEPGDRYVHADLPGAPSVVVKNGSEAAEASLREACRFAVAHSQAWRAGLGAGSAYWVTPEQVSKTAQSGEYLKTGSFVIRGKRNHFPNLELILALGEVSYEGTPRLVSGDPEAVAAHTDRYLVVKPAGRGSRQDLAAFLSEAFQVPPEDAERVLPAGTFDVVEGPGINLEAWTPG